jgi:hypothetical protein
MAVDAFPARQWRLRRDNYVARDRLAVAGSCPRKGGTRRAGRGSLV